MESIGLDLHKHESQLCILTEAGEVVEQSLTRRPLSTAGRTPRTTRSRRGDSECWVPACRFSVESRVNGRRAKRLGVAAQQRPI
jgi:hypothetical protein